MLLIVAIFGAAFGFMFGLFYGQARGRCLGFSDGIKKQSEDDKAIHDSVIGRLRVKARTAACDAVSDAFDEFTEEMERQAK